MNYTAVKAAEAYERGLADGRAEVTAQIAAAEERGRRAGIEERDELRALLTQFVEMANHPSYCDPLEGECSCGLSTLLDNARAALAPRDSGRAGVVLPLPLAQRILAALELTAERTAGYGAGNFSRSLHVLAAELRAAVERKP